MILHKSAVGCGAGPDSPRRRLRGIATLLLAACTVTFSMPSANRGYSAEERSVPNIVSSLRRPRLRRREVPQPAGQDRHAEPRPARGQGMVFTDAHTSSSVCTPTRYGILTGRYNWRSRLQTGVLGGFSAAAHRAGRLTVPALLKQHGYHTRLHRQVAPRHETGRQGGRREFGDGIESIDAAEARSRASRSPTARRRAASTTTSASARRSTCRPSRSSRTTASPQCRPPRRSGSGTGPGRARLRGGRRAADAHPQGASSTSASAPRRSRAVLPLPAADLAAHARSLPTTEWQGKSGLNAYADFVMQTDCERRRRCCRRWSSSGARRQHAGHLHQRQRLLARGRHFAELAAQGPPSQRPLPRPQGRHLGRRPPRAVHRPLAAAVKPGSDQRSTDLPHRPDGHLRRHPRRTSCPTTPARTA